MADCLKRDISWSIIKEIYNLVAVNIGTKFNIKNGPSYLSNHSWGKPLDILLKDYFLCLGSLNLL
jgi:hypothetical protein